MLFSIQYFQRYFCHLIDHKCILKPSLEDNEEKEINEQSEKQLMGHQE